MGVEKVFEYLTRALRQVLSALYLQSLPCQTVNLNGLLRDLLHRQEVPVVPPRFSSILEPQDCYLNWLVVLEA